MKKILISCAVIIPLGVLAVMFFIVPLFGVRAEGDITEYVHVSTTSRHEAYRWEGYNYSIYIENERWAHITLAGKIDISDYSKDGYFAIFFSGWNPCTACKMFIPLVYDTGDELIIDLKTSTHGPGGAMIIEWNLFLEIPERFLYRDILVNDIREDFIFYDGEGWFEQDTIRQFNLVFTPLP